ncbi:MAG: transglycosylase SLT domain-containing protein [Thermoanaerobaculia bacterium]|nr:transglycosylase SLT domain-containing protein [Thermoanaerobaculia bacterium]
MATLAEARALRQAGKLDAYERALRHFATSSETTLRRQASAYLGLHLFDQKRFDESAPTLTAAAAEQPLVAPFLQLRVIESEARRANFAAAIRTAEEIIATSPQTSAAQVARLRLPALQAQLGNLEATDAALAATASIPVDELNERDFVDLAGVLEASGRADLAMRVRMRLLTDYTQGRFTEKTYGQLAAAADSPIDLLTLDESTRLASRLARADRYDQALDLFKRIERRFPDSATSADFQSVRIRALFSSRNYAQLLDETKPEDLKDPAMQLIRARAAWREDRPQEFLAALARIEKSAPASREATEARIARAKYYITDEIDYVKSLSDLNKAIDSGALGNEGENLWTLGWTYTLAGQYADAMRVFDRYVETFPDGDYKTNSLFWTAKVHERSARLPQRDAALRQVIAEYPYSYYAYRAREIMGQPVTVSSEIEGGAIFPDIDAQLALVPVQRLDAVRELMALELISDATREMKSLATEYPDNSGVAFMLADIYVAGGEPFKANGILQRRFRQFVRHGGAGVPRRFWEILFPLNYWDAIRREAERRGHDPYLLASIIRQESGFEPTVVSNAGAVGLMQIMPDEAARIASLAGIEGISRERLFDPDENIAVGAAEYSQKLQIIGGNPTLAIAAYNAGEEAVGNWLARTSIDDMDLFVESIPFAETRLYVKSVTRNRFEYRRIYESSNAATQQSQ